MPREKILSVTLADCEVQTFRSGGKGGQNQNKRDTGVRIIHPPSGAVGESREERSQLQNKKTAFTRMVKTGKFQVWLARETMTTEERLRIERRYTLREEDCLIEGRETGRWEPIS